MRKIKLDKKKLTLDAHAVRNLTANMLADVKGGNGGNGSTMCPWTREEC
jgi:hypothetical protein